MDGDDAASDVEAIQKALAALKLNGIEAPEAVGLLANASRHDESTRQQLADPQILRILIEVIESSINDSIETAEVALRCLGNACIDNNVAKQEITKTGFSWARHCLPDGTQPPHMSPDTAIGMLTAKVLYNICSDYEPAQQKCFDEHVHHDIIRVCISSAIAESEDSPLFLELLFWICSHVVPEQVDLPHEYISMLLGLDACFTGQLDAEDFALLVETCLLFLREGNIREKLIGLKQVDSVWTLLESNEDRIEAANGNEEDLRLLLPLSKALIWILSDIAAEPEFASRYDLSDELMQKLVIATIEGAPDNNEDEPMCPRLVDAACQVLGNLLWSAKEGHAKVPLQSEAIEPLREPVVIPALHILRLSQDVDLLHSATGLLIQIIRISSNDCKLVGSSEGVETILERLCKHAMPQVRQDGISLLRVLGKDSPAIQQRFAQLAREAVKPNGNHDTAMVGA